MLICLFVYFSLTLSTKANELPISEQIIDRRIYMKIDCTWVNVDFPIIRNLTWLHYYDFKYKELNRYTFYTLRIAQLKCKYNTNKIKYLPLYASKAFKKVLINRTMADQTISDNTTPVTNTLLLKYVWELGYKNTRQLMIEQINVYIYRVWKFCHGVTEPRCLRVTVLCYLKTEVIVNTDGLRAIIDELCYIVLENTLRTEYTVKQGY